MKSFSKKNSIGATLSFKMLFWWMIDILPLVLFCSYYPVITLGEDETMYLELSLPLLWLVLFDALVVVTMFRRKMLFTDWRRKWPWLLLPAWLTLSAIWSQNNMRGFLTIGVVWLVYLALDGMWSFRKLFDGEFRTRWWKWFFGSTLVVCGWCLLQCVLDLAGVSKEYTLMCEGCTYRMFGFPHPNGLAIEPQFMGNLLLAPVLLALWFVLFERKKSSCQLSLKFLVICLFISMVTLFLTFSRGAIYALVMAVLVMSVLVLIREKKERKKMVRQVGIAWVILIVSFGVALNVQGLMAAVSPTNDTYGAGVAKVLNHLSLGVIDINNKEKDVSLEEGQVLDSQENRGELVEKPVENFESEQAFFDGYVAESTNVRLMISGAGLETWRQDLKTILIGVGLGGAGQALYQNGLTTSPKEIIQNQFVSLLLETGLVGVLLLMFTVYLVLRLVTRSAHLVILMSLMVAYSVTLCFFSGLVNALQIYLLPVVIGLVLERGR